MENTSNVLKIGDQVTIKTNPAFRGVISSFYAVVNNFGKTQSINGPVEITKTQIIARVATLDESFVETTKDIRVIQLKLVERY